MAEISGTASDFYRNVIGGLRGRNLEQMTNAALKRQEIQETAQQYDGNEYFSSFLGAIEGLKDSIEDPKSRKDVLDIQKQNQNLESLIKITDKVSDDEKKILFDLVNNTKEMISTQKMTTYSLGNSIKESLYDNLGGITGVLSSFGLNNPMFMFLGGFLDDFRKKRKEAREENQSQLVELVRQQELISAKEQNEPMKDRQTEMYNESMSRLAEQMSEMDMSKMSISDIMDKATEMSNQIGREVIQEYQNEEDDQNTFSELQNRVSDLVSEQTLTNELLSETIENDRQYRRFLMETEREKLAAMKKGGNLLELPGKEDEEKKGLLSGLFENLAFALPIPNFMTMMKGLGNILGKFVKTGIPLLTMFTGIYKGFKGWTNTAERLNKDVNDIDFRNRLASSISGFFEGFFSIFDYVLPDNLVETLTGYPTMAEWMKESLLTPLDDLFHMTGEDWELIFDQINSDITGIFKTNLVDPIKGFIFDLSTTIKDTFKDLFSGISGGIKNIIPEKLTRFLPSEEKERGKEVMNRLDKIGVIEDNFDLPGRHDEIKNWNAIRNLPSSDLNGLISSGKFRSEDMRELTNIRNNKIPMMTGVHSIPDLQNRRSIQMSSLTDSISNNTDSINRKKVSAGNPQTSTTASKMVNNNNQNITNMMPVSTREKDYTTGLIAELAYR